MISVVIEERIGDATIHVQVDDSASTDDLRSAWEEVLSGMLEHNMRDAIWFACVARGLDPHEIVTDPRNGSGSASFVTTIARAREPFCPLLYPLALCFRHA
jgi:hypothetical protein